MARPANASPASSTCAKATRTSNDSKRALAELEGGAAALAFSSGMAAITALLDSLPSGAHVRYPQDCYAGLRVLVTEFLPQRGVSATAVDIGDVDAVRAAMTPKTAHALARNAVESAIAHLRHRARLAEVAHAQGAIVACDNTFATPLLQQPLALGADVVMHSTTKYFGGHSDAPGWRPRVRAPRRIVRRCCASPPHHRRRAFAVQRLADAARTALAAGAHGLALPQRARRCRIPAPQPARRSRAIGRACRRIRITR